MKEIYKKYGTIIITLLLLLVIILIRNCEKEPKIVTKTEIDIDWIKDSIKNVLIKEIKPVYIDTGSTKYVKGDVSIKWKDSIVYVDKPTKTTIKANQYKTTISSNEAKANLEITTSGELLDVQGTIEYPKETKTITTTITKAKSGLFIYGSVPVNPDMINVEAGLMYQFKNTIGVMGGVQYNQITKRPDLKVGLVVKIL